MYTGWINPHETAKTAAVEHNRVGAAATESFGVMFLSDPEHKAGLAGAAQHVTAQHEADAAKHRLLVELAAVSERAAKPRNDAFVKRQVYLRGAYASAISGLTMA